MKKIYLLFLFVILFIPNIVLANSISNIDMNIYVDSSGTAHVTEEWTAILKDGTEGYKPYYNLGESVISNFKVKMIKYRFINDKPIEYEFSYLDDWDVSGSFEDKKYKNGINYIDNGVELCFGISSYGDHKYTLSYDISNFVVNTSDGYQMIYWNLFPYDFSLSPERVYIKIYSDFEYSDDLDVWGYGKHGAPTYVYGGYIEMDSETKVYSDEYMTILVKFPSNSFDASVVLDKTFDEYLAMANDGARQYSAEKDNFFNVLLSIFSFLFCVGFPILIIIISIINKKNKYGYKNNKKINKENAPMFRDIPCNKDIYMANTLIKLNSDTFKSYKATNIFGAIILKWVKEKKIIFKNKGNGKFNKNTSSIDLTLNPTFDKPLEKELFDIMYEASKNGILETKELEKWCEENYTKFFDLFERMTLIEIEKLKADNHIYKRTDKKECKYKNVMDDTIYDESVKLYGFKRFLEEFSRIGTREVIEVHMWEEYLMYAYLLGIAHEVTKQLKKMYPEVLKNPDNYVDFDTLMYIDYISNKSVTSASSARSRAESYSSGGGGFSAGGGGGGSFGGGGGGGGFR